MPLMPNVHIMPFVTKIHNANYAHNAIFTSNPMPNTNTMPIYAAYLALNECIFGIGWLHIWHCLIVNYMGICIRSQWHWDLIHQSGRDRQWRRVHASECGGGWPTWSQPHTQYIPLRCHRPLPVKNRPLLVGSPTQKEILLFRVYN